MIFREVTIEDIDYYMIVRKAEKENILNNPALVPKEDNVGYLTKNKNRKIYKKEVGQKFECTEMMKPNLK